MGHLPGFQSPKLVERSFTTPPLAIPMLGGSNWLLHFAEPAVLLSVVLISPVYYWVQFVYTWSCWAHADGREVETPTCAVCCREKTCSPARTIARCFNQSIESWNRLMQCHDIVPRANLRHT